jgi:hypothetical protein
MHASELRRKMDWSLKFAILLHFVATQSTVFSAYLCSCNNLHFSTVLTNSVLYVFTSFICVLINVVILRLVPFSLNLNYEYSLYLWRLSMSLKYFAYSHFIVISYIFIYLINQKLVCNVWRSNTLVHCIPLFLPISILKVETLHI